MTARDFRNPLQRYRGMRQQRGLGMTVLYDSTWFGRKITSLTLLSPARGTTYLQPCQVLQNLLVERSRETWSTRPTPKHLLLMLHVISGFICRPPAGVNMFTTWSMLPQSQAISRSFCNRNLLISTFKIGKLPVFNDFPALALYF